MKIAKASEADIDMAMDLANVLDDIERGFFPTKLQSDEDLENEAVEWIDTKDRQPQEHMIHTLGSRVKPRCCFCIDGMLRHFCSCLVKFSPTCLMD